MNLPSAQILPTAPVAAAGLVGGYLVARTTGVRPLGGAVLAGAGVLAGRSWLAKGGPATTAALSAIYLGGFGASHPAWPAVLGAAAASAGAAHMLSDRR